MPEINFAQAQFGMAYGKASQLPGPAAPEFVFAGRSNVGKSSLINKLCNRKKLARVSATPGKTATVNFYNVGDVFFVDLPGYGYAKTSMAERKRWDELINGYFASKRYIVLLVQLLDCRHDPSKDDLSMLEYLNHYDIPFVAALTKADKLKPSQWDACIDRFKTLLVPYKGCRDILLTSAEKGMGIEALQDILTEAVAKDTEAADDDGL